MRISADTYLLQVNRSNMVRSSFRKICLTLSLLVILGVFWALKLTGITMAGEAFCGMEEHIHGEDCTERVVICGLEENTAHIHTEKCLYRQLYCTLPEQDGHSHSDACMDMVLECTLEEENPHSHDDGCYVQEPGCEQEESEEHLHDESCMVSQLLCAVPETPGHIHTEECYSPEPVPVCGEEELEAHFHGDGCYLVEEGNYCCGLEEMEIHSHTDECFILQEACTLEEHIHTANCYSDLSADLETKDDWDRSVEGIMRGPSTAENILMVARSQLGVSESSRNFYVDEFGVRRGITRYGQWYGNPYGDWSAMFVSFCLDYADVKDLPSNAGPESMRLAWEKEELYAPAAEHEPVPGQIVFLDKDGNGAADSVAIVAGMEENVLFVVEGDSSEQVTQIGSVNLYPEKMPEEPAAEEIPEEPAEEPAAEETPEEPSEEPAAEETPEEPAEEPAAEETPEEPAEEPVAEETPEEPAEEPAAEEIPEEPAEEPAAEEAPEEPEPQTDRVLETLYSAEDPAIMGYGLVPFRSGLMRAAATRAARRTIWLDGTNGGLMSLSGSPNVSYTAEDGTIFQLPTEWQSPEKYSYTLRGWYDITTNQYYEPGAEVKVNGNTVFYADWQASTYDIGEFNSQVVDTISTDEFVTIRMFDYGALFNVLSEYASVTYGNGSHTDTWNLITNGNNHYNGNPTLNYIFRDWDRGSEDISYPNGTNDRNNPTDAGKVYQGLFTNTIGDLLFNPSTEVIGKQYLGEGDHLFQLCLDPNDPHYGYYYYNSERNAASYNQSDQRFYVYDYLECTRTSTSGEYEGKYADFLPLNSPYANTNGKRVNTYSYAGVNGEYQGTTHYMFDCRYNTDGCSTAYAGTNFWFGMSVDVEFYLPNKPGAQVSGGYGNQDIYGKDMHFQFSGDDDVWIFVDGVLVLDLGGIHGLESGDINFATGVVTINGQTDQKLSNNLKSLSAGEHTLSLYYLERGSSMSNCAMYFNLAPRFSFNIQKEDVLTRDVLNGAQFSVYVDKACTVPAELWTSKDAHDAGMASTNVFTVENGTAHMWGMGAGNTYYIKETKPPDNTEYVGLPNGVICLTFDKMGTANYEVEIVDTGNGISGGFTVHGFRLDPETQQAYIVATNAPVWVDEVTSIHARKQWQDQINHSADTITVYLTVTDQDGTVRRIREDQLSDANNWECRWENLPKHWEDGTLIQYGVEEAYIPGYYSRVEQVHVYSVWAEKTGFENGKSYLIQSNQGYLITQNGNADTGFAWIGKDEAIASNRARWTATVTGNGVRLTNGANQTLTFYYNGGSSGYPTDFFASTGGENNESKQYFRYTSTSNGLRLYYDGADGRDYYLVSSMTDSKKFQYNTNASNAMTLTPVIQEETPITEGVAFLVNNIPLERETAMEVRKYWDYGYLPAGTVHEQAQVTVKLLADGKDTGRTVTLSLKNGWHSTFQGLPYEDEDGNVIVYTVEEVWKSKDWIPSYGEITTSGGSPPRYSTEITNRYRLGTGGPMLPSTGTAGRMMYILCGSSIMLGSLVYGIVSRRKRERRME